MKGDMYLWGARCLLLKVIFINSHWRDLYWSGLFVVVYCLNYVLWDLSTIGWIKKNLYLSKFYVFLNIGPSGCIFLTQVPWIRWKTVKRVIYFICKYRCLNVLVIILNIFIMVGIMISCLKIMFLPRCSEHMSVINYLTVRYFPADIISPFYRGGTLWPNVCFLNVTRIFSNDLAFSIGFPS